ncbi:hypothetical protein ACIGNX_18160 [Actinosynnema sp. NPDC053489]|uniref:hypothetical protein n=1 Tax=Actinosynnema sp. NPDC053489 TaxID=3363916 RepID=UPI0037C663AC
MGRAAVDAPAATLRDPDADVRAAFDTDAHRVPRVVTSFGHVAQRSVEVVLR